MAVGIPARSKPSPSRRVGSFACSQLGKRAEELPRVELEIRKSSPDIPESTVPVLPEHWALPTASTSPIEFLGVASSCSLIFEFECEQIAEAAALQGQL